MTRSPLATTLVPLIPLAALGWPLAKALNKNSYRPEAPAETTTSPLVTADLFVRSAHPFKEVSVTIGEATWTYKGDDDVKEIHYPQGSEVTLFATVTWPEGTPETAAILELRPLEKEDRARTLWGFGEASEEITFSWDSQP